MNELLVIALAGFLASMVDGALGMGFGPTSASILLSSGLSPAATSATVNLAKIATGLAAGVSHWRFDNIDRRLVIRLAAPGAVGALVGATILASVDGDDLRPVLALALIGVGLRILVRFSRPLPAPTSVDASSPTEHDLRGVEIAGAAGGVTNGLVGAWGPVVTPFLLQRGLTPRYAIGSVNTAEVAVAVVSAGSLLTSIGGKGLELGVITAMLGGGVAAAPLAAWCVRFVPARLLGLAVAGLLLCTQSRELATAGWVPADRWIFYLTVPIAISIAALRPRIDRARVRAHATAPGLQRDSQASGSATSD